MASGNTLLVLGPKDYTPTASNFATISLRNSHPILEFDASTGESAVFDGLVLPRAYAGGGLTITLGIAMASATTGGVVFSAAIERIGASQQDIDADGFATAVQSAAVTVSGTSGNVFDVAIPLTSGAEMDSLAAGERFRLKVTRVVADAGDDATGDAQLVALEIKET